MRISGVCVELGKLDHANELRQSGGMGGAVQRRMLGRRGRRLRLGVERRQEEGNECDIETPPVSFVRHCTSRTSARGRWRSQAAGHAQRLEAPNIISAMPQKAG